MRLPLNPPYPPMEALAASELPRGEAWQYEPKWDGFRCLLFRDQDEVYLQSKAGQPLGRYFPELVKAALALKTKKFILDGEIVIPIGSDLSFDDLLMRIHPAESRVNKLAADTPALFVAFDLLVDAKGKLLAGEPLSKRRKLLDIFAGENFTGKNAFRLSPMTQDFVKARDWFRMNIGLDGVIAKRSDAVYESGERSGAIQKIKKLHTADCVVGGFRYASKERWVGSLLLGLYDNEGLLNHVGFTSSIHDEEREKLTHKLESLVKAPGFSGKAPGGPSRWSTKRSADWQPLDPKLVIEVQFDHFTGGRFRHGTKLLRWRPDKAPKQCTMAQVRRESKSVLNLL